GEIFSRVKPRLAVIYHSEGTPKQLAKAQKTYAGRLEMADDLMTIDIGDDIVVHRATPKP
ncbi:MAG TPA: hypothetical protein VFP40_18275, partial [Terriglobales bacterium]|nr:hypothetical protein [Terriglobales bacterium]